VELDGRTVSGGYRYGLHGMEIDVELKVKGNSYTTEYRQFDPRVVRWTSLDPRKDIYPAMSPFVFCVNNPFIYTDIKGDTIKFIGMSNSQFQSYNSFLKQANTSKLFNYYYSVLEKSTNTYFFKVDENLIVLGQFNRDNNTVSIRSIEQPAIITQEFFHAFQKELAVYGPEDHSTKETEGDLMTVYVANEAGFVTSGMLVLQSMEGGWAEDISNINGSHSKNPTNEQVQSEEYNKLFNEAINKRIDFYKTQGDDYKGYTTPNSNKQPKAIREVFNNINEDLK
jgi:RHS repeat-associated protein